MGVNKAVLEKMSSKELENYINPESKFVPEAIEYAFEILKDRGHQFNESELERWNSLKQKNIELLQPKVVHTDYKKAANIWYISTSLGLLSFIILNFIDPFITLVMLVMLVTLIILFGIGYLISKGYDWMKYFLLVIGIFGFFNIFGNLSFALYVYLKNPIIAIINIIQTILQIWVLVILFKIPKNT